MDSLVGFSCSAVVDNTPRRESQVLSDGGWELQSEKEKVTWSAEQESGEAKCCGWDAAV